MQLTLVQFLGALLTPGFTQGLTVDSGIVTLESGDTFDVKSNAQQLQTLLMSASVDLKDAHDQLVVFGANQPLVDLGANQPEAEPYYNDTRKQLVAVRKGLEALNTAGTKPVAPVSPTIADNLVRAPQ